MPSANNENQSPLPSSPLPSSPLPSSPLPSSPLVPGNNETNEDRMKRAVEKAKIKKAANDAIKLELSNEGIAKPPVGAHTMVYTSLDAIKCMKYAINTFASEEKESVFILSLGSAFSDEMGAKRIVRYVKNNPNKDYYILAIDPVFIDKDSTITFLAHFKNIGYPFVGALAKQHGIKVKENNAFLYIGSDNIPLNVNEGYNFLIQKEMGSLKEYKEHFKCESIEDNTFYENLFELLQLFFRKCPSGNLLIDNQLYYKTNDIVIYNTKEITIRGIRIGYNFENMCAMLELLTMLGKDDNIKVFRTSGVDMPIAHAIGNEPLDILLPIFDPKVLAAPKAVWVGKKGGGRTKRRSRKGRKTRKQK